MCLSFLFSQPQIYKMIILRVIKVDTSCTSVEQSLVKQTVTGDRICPISSFLCRSCYAYTPQGFVINHLLDLHHLDELKNFATNNLLQLVVEVAYCNPRTWLVTYWELCIENERLSLQNKSNGYWGKGSTIGWYKVLGLLYL